LLLCDNPGRHVGIVYPQRRLRPVTSGAGGRVARPPAPCRGPVREVRMPVQTGTGTAPTSTKGKVMRLIVALVAIAALAPPVALAKAPFPDTIPLPNGW